MADPRKPYVPAYMRQGTSGSRADRILRERLAKKRNELERATEQEEIGSQYYSSSSQSRLNPSIGDFAKGITQREKDLQEKAKQVEAQQKAFRYVMDSDLQQEESRNKGNPNVGTGFVTNVNPSKDKAFKDAVEKAEGRARRPKPATPQDSQELELNERKYGIGSMSLLKDEDIKRQDDDIKKAQLEKKAKEQKKAKALKNVEDAKIVSAEMFPEATKGGKVDPTFSRASDPMADEERYGSAGYNISRDFQNSLNAVSIESSEPSKDFTKWSIQQGKDAKTTKAEFDKFVKQSGKNLESLIAEEEKMLEASSSTGYSKDTSPKFAIDTDLQQEESRGSATPTPLTKETAENLNIALALEEISPSARASDPWKEVSGEETYFTNPVVSPSSNKDANKVASTDVDNLAINVDGKGNTTIAQETLQTALDNNRPYSLDSAKEIWDIHKEWAEDVINAQYNSNTPPAPDWNLLAKIRYQFKLPNSQSLKEKNYGLSQKDYDKAISLNYLSEWTPSLYKNLEKQLEEIKDTTKVEQSNNVTEVETNFSSSSAVSNPTIQTLGGSNVARGVQSPDGGHSYTAINTKTSFPVEQLQNVKNEAEAEDVKQTAFNIIDKEGQNKSLTPEDYKNNPVINGKTVKEWSFSNWDTRSNKKVKKDQYPSVIVYQSSPTTWSKVDLESGVVNVIKGDEKPPSRWKVPMSAIKVAQENTPPSPNLPSGFIVLETQKKTPKNKKFNVRGKEGKQGFTVGVTKGQVKFRLRAKKV
jgi:hypothetical protein